MKDDVWSMWTFKYIRLTRIKFITGLEKYSIFKNSSILCISFKKTNWCRSLTIWNKHTAVQIQRNWIGSSNCVMRKYLIKYKNKNIKNKWQQNMNLQKWLNEIAHHTHEVTVFNGISHKRTRLLLQQTTKLPYKPDQKRE